MSGHDLSHIQYSNRGAHEYTRVAIVVSKWNPKVTNALYEGAKKVLLEAGLNPKRIYRLEVPGTFELAMGAAYTLTTHLPPEFGIMATRIEGVICLGCVVQGETRHFDFICQAASQGIMEVGLKYNTPVIFGVLTTDNQQQALDRAGGKYGNKGEEAAVAVLEMIDLRKDIQISFRL